MSQCLPYFKVNKIFLFENAGIGLNVGNWEPTTCLDALMQDMVPGAPPFEREEFLALFFGKFEQLFSTFVKEGKLQHLRPICCRISCDYLLPSWYVIGSSSHVYVFYLVLRLKICCGDTDGPLYYVHRRRM